MPIHYRSVNWLAYRVSVSTSAARHYAAEAERISTAAQTVELPAGPDHYDLLVPEIKAQAHRAAEAGVRAEAAWKRAQALASRDLGGPVTRVADGASLHWPDDVDTRTGVSKCFADAWAARAEAHLALEIVQAFDAVLASIR